MTKKQINEAKKKVKQTFSILRAYYTEQGIWDERRYKRMFPKGWVVNL